MLFRRRVTSAGLVEVEELDRIDEDVESLIDESVREAKEAPEPSSDKLITDVYASY
jgi:pyruvate dehydrogenase E1 component alpha subunit